MAAPTSWASPSVLWPGTSTESAGEFEGVVPSDEPVLEERAQSLSDGEQTLSDADQTSADRDQTSSDADAGAAERDQRAAERDQAAADVDQATSDQAQRSGADSDTYASSQRTRSQTTLERDEASHMRSRTAGVREATAERRDRDADARDVVAAARDQHQAALDTEIDRLDKSGAAADDGAGSGSSFALELLLRARRYRNHAAAGRARAADQRENAAGDRELARQDREQAAADRRELEEQLAGQGLDSLTGVTRRRVGLAVIQRELDRTRRTHDSLFVAFVDVAGLNALNDTQGHAAGDDLLRRVAECLRLTLRPYDVITRYSGHEFVCSLSGQDTGARSRFDQVSALLTETHRRATITVGLAEADVEESLDALIARSARAMTSSQNGGSAPPR